MAGRYSKTSVRQMIAVDVIHIRPLSCAHPNARLATAQNCQKGRRCTSRLWSGNGGALIGGGIWEVEVYLVF